MTDRSRPAENHGGLFNARTKGFTALPMPTVMVLVTVLYREHGKSFHDQGGKPDAWGARHSPDGSGDRNTTL